MVSLWGKRKSRITKKCGGQKLGVTGEEEGTVLGERGTA